MKRPSNFRIMLYRLGAWLLKPHVMACLDHYNNSFAQFRAFPNDPTMYRSAQDIAHVRDGLRYAIGIDQPWQQLENDKWVFVGELQA